MTFVDAFLLADINRAASPHLRAGDDAGLIREYAAAMAAGQVFPRVLIFIVDGVAVVADGHHRIAAAASIGRTTIAAEVHVGTLAEAVWAGVGVNRAHGKRMTKQDKSCGVRLLLETCPEKLQDEIAVQLGCSRSLVGKIARRISKATGGAPDLRGRRLRLEQQRDQIRALTTTGLSSTAIHTQLKVHPSVIAAVRRDMGMGGLVTLHQAIDLRVARIRELAASGLTAKQIAPLVSVHPDTVRADMRAFGIVAPHRVGGGVTDSSPYPKRPLEDALRAQIEQLLRDGVPIQTIAKTVKRGPVTIAWVRDSAQIPRAVKARTRTDAVARLTRIRTMAEEGYTTRQIAAAVGLGRERLREITKQHAIAIPADKVVGLTHRHDSNRIVDRIVMTAENLTAGLELVHYAELDPTQLGHWLTALRQAREDLNAFIRRLMQEHQENPNEAADPQPVSA